MPARKKAVAIRHVPFEDLGTIEAPLTRHGYSISYREAGLDDLRAIEADLLIVLGGPIGAYEDDIYPFLRDEISLLENRLAAARPTLGICLGAQLMARALGARVYPGPKKEIGWEPLILTAAGETSCVRHFGPGTGAMLHWHGDTFDLPEGASLLASTLAIPNQIYSRGNALAFQCHPEVTDNMEPWFIGHAHEIAHTPDVDVPSLRDGAWTWGTLLARQSHLCFDEWLTGLAD